MPWIITIESPGDINKKKYANLFKFNLLQEIQNNSILCNNIGSHVSSYARYNAYYHSGLTDNSIYMSESICRPSLELFIDTSSTAIQIWSHES